MDDAEIQAQLMQLDQGIASTSGAVRDEFISLKNQLLELLSEEAAARLQAASDESNSNAENEDDSGGGNSPATKEKLAALETLCGSKCSAPFSADWGHKVYQNAVVTDVLDADGSPNDIKVRVLFLQPTTLKMKPCEFFLEGRCKFDEGRCRQSHGHVVPFRELRDYEEPNFDEVREKSFCLAKTGDGLWHRCVVEHVDSASDSDFRNCSVKFTNTGKTASIAINELHPLKKEVNSSDADSSSGDSDSSDEGGDDVEAPASQPCPEEAEPTYNWNHSLLGTDRLGEWEQHTKGMGSKLMIKMGYVMGQGLGKHAEGRVEPVAAYIFPPGKSLDHCMELAEKMGDREFFKAEKRLAHVRKKAEAATEREYLRQKAAEKHDVFNVINSLQESYAEPSSSASSSRSTTPKTDLKRMSVQNLNVDSLKVADDISREERNLKKLEGSLNHHLGAAKAAVVQKIEQSKRDLRSLQAHQRNIEREQQARKGKQKLSVF